MRRLRIALLRRRQREDSGSILIESIVAIGLVTVVLASLTTVLVTGTQSTNRQRSAQAAAQINTSALDVAQMIGGAGAASGKLADPVYAEVNGTVFTTQYTVKDCRPDPSDNSCTPLPGTPGSNPFVLVTATTTWEANNCPAGACEATVSTILNTNNDPIFGSASKPILNQDMQHSMEGKPVYPDTHYVTASNAIAPPLAFRQHADVRELSPSAVEQQKCLDADGPYGSPRPANWTKPSPAWTITVDPATGELTGEAPLIPYEASIDQYHWGYYCVRTTVTDAHNKTDTKNYIWKTDVQCFRDFDGTRQNPTPTPGDGNGTWYGAPYDRNDFFPKNVAACKDNVEYTIYDLRYWQRGDSVSRTWVPGIMGCGSHDSFTNAPRRTIVDPYEPGAGTRSQYYCTSSTGKVTIFNYTADVTYCFGVDMRNVVTNEVTSYTAIIKLPLPGGNPDTLPIPPACRE